jgi:hypothetical protein
MLAKSAWRNVPIIFRHSCRAASSNVAIARVEPRLRRPPAISTAKPVRKSSISCSSCSGGDRRAARHHDPGLARRCSRSRAKCTMAISGADSYRHDGRRLELKARRRPAPPLLLSLALRDSERPQGLLCFHRLRGSRSLSSPASARWPTLSAALTAGNAHRWRPGLARARQAEGHERDWHNGRAASAERNYAGHGASHRRRRAGAHRAQGSTATILGRQRRPGGRASLRLPFAMISAPPLIYSARSPRPQGRR